jgi:heat-inducible transcriptional repressor
VQLVELADRIVMLVVVLSNGVIEKRTLELDEPVDQAALDDAAGRLATELVGRTVHEVDRPAQSSPGTSSARLLDAAWLALSNTAQAESEAVYIGGTSQMASAFDAVATVSEVLRILEQQFVVVTLVRDVLDRGLSVAIGSETGIQPLADCALVVAPYEVGGEPAGSIGVLGPTRMNYPQALAAVAVVSHRLGRRLTEG